MPFQYLFNTLHSADRIGVKAMEGRGCFSERLLVQLIFLLCAFVNVALCTLTEEISANSLAVRFDEIYDIDKWEQARTDGFTDSVTEAVNYHCMESANYADCQISAYSSSFTVVLSSASPEYFNGDIRMTFHVRIPEADRADDATLEYVVPVATVTTIVKDNVEAIQNGTWEGKKIVFIGDERQYEIDTSLDTIMIPIVVVLFLVVVLLAVCLTCMQTRGEKKLQEQRAQQVGSKGDEGITLTAVKSGSYASDDNNGDPSTSKTGKRFRRQKKRKDGQETPAARAPVQVQPVVQSSGSKTSIEVKPAHTEDNFSSNNSNDIILPKRSGSRHGIELPPLTTVSTPRTMSLDGSDSDDKDRKKEKKKKKHHRKLSKQSLVDAIDRDDECEDEKSLSPLPEDHNQDL